MDLLFWRHAEAEDSYPDLARVLTRKGQRQAKEVGEWLNTQLPDNCKIIVSPAQRTQETAAAIGRKFKTVDSLAPDASPQDYLTAAEWPQAKQKILIVGHQPTIGGAISLLLYGEERALSIKKGQLWWLTTSDLTADSTEDDVIIRARQNAKIHDGDAKPLVKVRVVVSPEFL